MWVPDDPDDDDEDGSASGHSILSCTQFTRPTSADIADLLRLFDEQQDRAMEWAVTKVGEPLGGLGVRRQRT